MKGHKTHQDLYNERDDNPDGLLLHLRFEFRGAAVDQIINNHNIATDHYAYGNKEVEEEPYEVDGVVVAHVDDVLHLDAGGEVGDEIGVIGRGEQGQGAAQCHKPHAQTRHHGLGDVPQLLDVLWLDNGHVAISTDQSKQPQSHAGVENGEGRTDPAEELTKGPVVLVVVNHPKGEQQDEGEIYHRHVYHVDSDGVPLLSGQGKHPESGEIDYDSDDEDEAVEYQACHAVLQRPLVSTCSPVLYRHVGVVQIQRHTKT